MNEKKFISLLSDTTFKYLFKNEKFRPWYTNIIKDLTGIDLEEYKLVDNELNTGTNTLRDFRMDILLKKNDYDFISIEMNSSENNFVSIKNHKYAYKLSGLQKTKDTYKVNYVVQINFNNWFSKKDRECAMEVYLMHDREKNLTLDGMKIIEVYLPAFKKLCYNNPNERYLAMFTANSYEEMLSIAGDDMEALKVMDELKRLADNDIFTSIYDKEAEYETSMISAMTEGLEKGIEKGSKETKDTIAKNMLAKNLSVELISECLGLSIEEINKLK